MPISELIRYRGWKVWFSYDMHITLLAIFYILFVDNLFRPFDSLLLISSFGFYFMYGFLINDFFDMPYDIAAGKERIVHKLPKSAFIGLILTVILISILHLLYLKALYFTIIYVLSFILATFYSAPPIRFKARGVSGTIVNGLIEKALPVSSVFAFFHHFEMDMLIFVVSSFFIHISEIMMHQILDYENDLMTGIRSFVTDIGRVRALKIFKRCLCPFTAILMLSLCLLICIKISYAIFIAILVFAIYAIIFLLIQKRVFVRQENIFPLYMSCLFFLICNAFPPFIAFLLCIKENTNIILLLFSIFSQYYVVKYRFESIKGKIIPHIEIFSEK
ncbi:MAG: hypothetical protein DRH15_12815 [Deltaproteobacteria bacterium]|nr:MAG: hypothetical protein DRH15_12815 [Deltaproteobacteria bacterium]